MGKSIILIIGKSPTTQYIDRSIPILIDFHIWTNNHHANRHLADWSLSILTILVRDVCYLSNEVIMVSGFILTISQIVFSSVTNVAYQGQDYFSRLGTEGFRVFLKGIWVSYELLRSEFEPFLVQHIVMPTWKIVNINVIWSFMLQITLIINFQNIWVVLKIKPPIFTETTTQKDGSVTPLDRAIF